MTHFPKMLKQELKGEGTDMTNASTDKMKKAKKTICEKFLAALMLSGANKAKYNQS